MLTLLDGGMGTRLQEKGLGPSESPEDWSITHPEIVRAIHRDYAKAGSNIVYTNTFGANRLKYHGAFALSDVIRASVELAKSSGAKVALDLGPTGKLLKPIGDLEFESAVEAFAETVRIGVEAGADLVAIETMSDLYELKAAVVATKENSTLPVYATVALQADGKLLTGGSVEAFAVLMESLDVTAYGFNCGLSPELMLPFVRRLKELSTKPIIVKPNAGIPRVEGGKTVFDMKPAEFASCVKKLVEAGASVIGGCCGMTDEFIRELAK